MSAPTHFVLDHRHEPRPADYGDALVWVAATRRFPELYVVGRTQVGPQILRTEFLRELGGMVPASGWFRTLVEGGPDDGGEELPARVREILPGATGSHTWAEALELHDDFVLELWWSLSRVRRWWSVRPRDLAAVPEIDAEPGAEAPEVATHPNAHPRRVYRPRPGHGPAPFDRTGP